MNKGKNHLIKPFWTKTKSYYLCVGRIVLIYNHRIVDTNLFYRKLASFIYLPTASHLWRKNGDLTYLLVSICTCLHNEKTKFSLLVEREIFQRIKSYSICRLLISIEMLFFCIRCGIPTGESISIYMCTRIILFPRFLNP